MMVNSAASLRDGIAADYAKDERLCHYDKAFLIFSPSTYSPRRIRPNSAATGIGQQNRRNRSLALIRRYFGIVPAYAPADSRLAISG